MNCTRCGKSVTMLVNGRCDECNGGWKKLPTDPPKRPKAPAAKSSLEHGFAQLAQLGALPPFEVEFYFHPERKFRFDVAWPEQKVAVEMEGGVYQKGKRGHTSITGLERDIKKGNAAVALGWRVLRFTAKDLRERPFEVIEEVKAALGLPF